MMPSYFLPRLISLAVNFKASSAMNLIVLFVSFDNFIFSFAHSLIPFDFQDIRELSPEQFVKKLKEQCKASIVYVGEDFRFGHQRSGDAILLKTLCEKQKIEVYIINQVEYEGEIVSCTAIRELVQ